MALGEEIYTLLTNDSPVAAIVSTRIYPLIAPQDAAVPFIVYQRISGNPVNEMAGYASLENPRYQVDAYADSYAAARDLATKIHTAMDGCTTFAALLQSDTDL